MSIFDTIIAKAHEGEIEAPASTAIFDGTRIVPTEGFVLPVAPATKTLYTYQLAAVESILASRRILLGLQPGLGKTAIMQAVVAAEAAQGRKSLVVVPPSLKISPWAEEFAADYPQLKVVVVSGTKLAPFPTDADVVILGDSTLSQRSADVTEWAPANILADEAHRYKTRDTKRSKALLALADALPANGIVVAATGTIVSNHSVDVYHPLRCTSAANATAVSGGHSWTRFMDAWCQTEMVWNGRANIRVATGCKDTAGLRAALTSTCYVSVPREEVLDLPARTTAVRSLVLNGDGAKYRRAEKEFLAWIRETKGDDAMHRAAKAEAITKLMALWEQDGLAKVKATTEYIDSIVEQGEPVVVFAHHKSVVLALFEALSNSGLRVGAIIGGMSATAKAEVVTDFQAGNLDILIGNIEAAGTGLTLTASRHVVFAQLPWAPGTFAQASDRVYRIGQERHVTTHILNMSEGVSQHLWAILMGKVETADAINTGTDSTIPAESVQEAVLSSYGW